MKNNKYKRLKKVIWSGASSGVVTGLIIMGVASPALAETSENSVPTYTQNTQVSPMHMMRRWNSPSKAMSLATSLGLDPVQVSSELKSGKNLKQILQENGIVPDQLHKAFGSKKSHNKRMWKASLSRMQDGL
jgi:hypothetical protein